MEYTLQIIEIVLIFIIGIVIYLSRKSLDAYASEKGKNFATKQDIEEITDKVQRVESIYNIRSSGIIDYNSIKIKAILDYYSSLNTWISTTSTSFPDTSKEHISINKSVLKRIQDAYLDCSIKESHLDVFINEKECKNLCEKISVSVLEFQHDFFNHIIETDYLLELHSDNLQERNDKITKLSKEFYNKRALVYIKVVANRKNIVDYLDKTIQEIFK